jgi:hypothetical protein
MKAAGAGAGLGARVAWSGRRQGVSFDWGRLDHLGSKVVVRPGYMHGAVVMLSRSAAAPNPIAGVGLTFALRLCPGRHDA